MRVFSGPGVPGNSGEIRPTFSLEPHEGLRSPSSSQPVVSSPPPGCQEPQEPLGNRVGNCSFHGVGVGLVGVLGEEGLGRAWGGHETAFSLPLRPPHPSGRHVLVSDWLDFCP